MDRTQEYMLKRQIENRRGSLIIDGLQNQKFNTDSYTNLLNKFGTSQDSSTRYTYQAEAFASDMELVRLYEGNGLFAKIIDRPAEEAVKHGLDIDYGDEDIAEYVESRLDELDFEDKFTTAEKWARLYGGAIIVMLVDDGRGLEEPLDWDNVTKIEELRVFERSVVQADYSQLNNFHFFDSQKNHVGFGEPQFYQVFSMYGYFLVHASRCLVFRNGRLPEQTTNSLYRYWGMPEYIKIRKALEECIVAHEDGVKLLERSVQAIYKMKNLANLLASSDGEDKVLQRLQVIDMARGILNSIAIDTDGEDYDFKTSPPTGVKDITDATCNMLSAVTNIPQTVLFGASPSGMNSTGDSDLENYYNMVENIQKQNMKKNVRTLLNLILKQGALDGSIPKVPTFKVKFGALWSLSETEQASLDSQKAATEKTKADTANVYLQAGVLDPSEVRQSLAAEGDFDIEEVLDDDLGEEPLDAEVVPDASAVSSLESSLQNAIQEVEGTTNETADADDDEADIIAEAFARAMADTQRIEKDGSGYADTVTNAFKSALNMDAEEDLECGVGVLVLKDGKFLVGSRANDEGLCGPGGHVMQGETFEDAARREAKEEFGIELGELHPLKQIKGEKTFLPSMEFLCTEFYGEPKCDEEEMFNPRWMTLDELSRQTLYGAFEKSLDFLRMDAKSGGRNIVRDKIGRFAETSSSGVTSLSEGKNEKGSEESSGGTSKESINSLTKEKSESKVNKKQKQGSDIEISADGKNIPCKGFRNNKARDNHEKHLAEFGLEMDEYEKQGIAFLTQKTGGDIDGYKTLDGEICRFNRKTGEYAKGIPGKELITYYIAKYNKKTGKSNIELANSYFDNLKNKESE